MKRFISVLCLLVLASCGSSGGGSGGSSDFSPSESAAGVTDFSGSYSRKDDDCSGGAVSNFTVTQSGTSATAHVLDDGTYHNAYVAVVDGQDTLVVSDSEFDCIAGFVLSQSDVNDIHAYDASLNVGIGDLVGACDDGNGGCYAVYN